MLHAEWCHAGVVAPALPVQQRLQLGHCLRAGRVGLRLQGGKPLPGPTPLRLKQGRRKAGRWLTHVPNPVPSPCTRPDILQGAHLLQSAAQAPGSGKQAWTPQQVCARLAEMRATQFAEMRTTQSTCARWQGPPRPRTTEDDAGQPSHIAWWCDAHALCQHLICTYCRALLTLVPQTKQGKHHSTWRTTCCASSSQI